MDVKKLTKNKQRYFGWISDRKLPVLAGRLLCDRVTEILGAKVLNLT